jgi:hypothetical protein
MPTLTLLEQRKLLTDPLQAGVVQVFAETSPVLQYLPFADVAGNAYRFNREQTLPGIGFRDYNEAYDPSTGVVQPMTEVLKVFGGLSQYDRALVKTQGNVNDLRAVHDSMKAKAAALDFTKYFFTGNATTDPEAFDGLEARLTGPQVQDVNGAPLELSHIDELIDSVVGSPDVLFMSKATRRYVNALRREAGQATEVVNDVFGRQINAYAGIPIGIIEEDATGAPILTEDIYAVRCGAGEYVGGLQAGPLEVIDQGLSGIFYTTLIEWICSFAVFHPRAAARLTGAVTA